MSQLRRFGFMIFLTFISGCAAHYVTLEEISLPKKIYPPPQEISNFELVLAQPDIVVETELSDWLDVVLQKRLNHHVNSISCHLTDELHSLLISKGFTISDTVVGRDHMSFIDKRNTRALFVPSIRIQLQEDSFTGFKRSRPVNASGNILMKSQVQIIMQEPLSGENVWIRNIPVDNSAQQVTYVIPTDVEASEISRSTVPEELAEVAKKIDSIFEDVAANILKASDQYIERDEFEFLNEDIQRLKKRQR